MNQVLKLPMVGELTDDEFFDLCMANPEIPFERDSKRRILIMPPAGTEDGARDLDFAFYIKLWNFNQDTPGIVFGPSTGFTLPNDAVRSPDTAWVRRDRWEQVPVGERKKFAHLVPDFVVEIKSESDSWRELKEKMIEFMENGVQLGWLLDPERKKVMVYSPENHHPDEQDFGILSGGDVLKGLELDLRSIFSV
jgi:Uma2 family endonuclease